MQKAFHSKSELPVDAFRNGEAWAFSAVFNEYCPALCFFSCRLTGDQAASKDIVEESFIKIWERRSLFFHQQVLKSYLYSTVRNASINWIKQNKNHVDITASKYEVADKDASCKLDWLIAAETLRELHAAIDKLPSQNRKIIHLLFLEGKKTGEVARELNISSANVSVQKKRGLLLLRKLLPNHFLFLVMGLIFFH